MPDDEVARVREGLVVRRGSAAQIREALVPTVGVDDHIGEVDRAAGVSGSDQHRRGDDLHVDVAQLGEEEVWDTAHKADVVHILRAAFI